METYLLMGLGAFALVAIVAIIVVAALRQAKNAGKAESVASQKIEEADAAKNVAQAAVESRPDPTSSDLPDRLRRSGW